MLMLTCNTETIFNHVKFPLVSMRRNGASGFRLKELTSSKSPRQSPQSHSRAMAGHIPAEKAEHETDSFTLSVSNVLYMQEKQDPLVAKHA
jgi:hypothetical protein